MRKCAPCRSCRLELPHFVRFWVGCRLQLAGFIPYSDKIQKDKSISKRICSCLVREWGYNALLLFTVSTLFTSVGCKAVAFEQFSVCRLKIKELSSRIAPLRFENYFINNSFSLFLSIFLAFSLSGMTRRILPAYEATITRHSRPSTVTL